MGYNRPRFPIPNDLRLHEQLPINNQSPTLPDSNTMGASIFETPISTKPPLDIFQKKLHEVNLPKNFVKINNNKAVETNKFYGNMFLDRQDNPVWTHPYSIWWSRDNFQGMAVSHIKKEQRVFGPPDAGDPAQYYFSPTGIKSFVFSYAEDINSMELGFENARHMSIETKLMKSENEYIRFPLIQGMGFVTAIYYNLTPKFYSQVGFRDIQAMPPPRAGMQKYKLLLENNVSWNLYISSSDTEITLTRVDGNTLVANKFCNKAVFQIVADTIAEIDNAAGCYPVDVNLNGSVASDIGLGQYSFVYVVEGNSNSGCSLLYALPHHLSTFTQGTLSKIIPTQLDSTTYGLMQGLITNILQLQVETPSDILFAPKRSTFNGGTESAKYSPDVLSSISKAATLEVETSNVLAETNLDSMYFSGKALAKYAWILYSCYYVLEDLTLTKKLLPELETALQKFIENKQILPLQYDTTWGGLVSSGTNAQDFGNSYYNDHHFHYGYHIITAAIIGQIEKELSGNSNWLLTNKDWIL
ncbi:related to Endo-1,3(4)-beta-glucanase 2 [Saccharomycodes ludwigii]|uniref:glucan endo-1,3-beta-D-glucosidase n=1 Tax=Saccharomycodes ludwigii TaxID=36035 RepID=A0A376BA61_9ASCO|nr:related to Endo-1,3(4)-beta-glucanase 2 [Saccharomycodes ludwigii]